MPTWEIQNQSEQACESVPMDDQPADVALREVVIGRLKEANARIEKASYEMNLYTRVSNACEAALKQLDGDAPQPCNPY